MHLRLPGRVAQALSLALLFGLTLDAQAQTGPDGKALFGQHCAPCHQPDASGTVGLAPALKGDHWVKLGAARHYLPTVVTHGLSGPIQVGSTRFVGSMPAFPQVNDADLAAILNHVRGLQGAGGEAAYTAAEVAQARTQAGSPPQTRTLRGQIVGP
jgi:mono/diheme cytochrome c family protein